MTIPTQMSLHGFIATAPQLNFTGNGVARQPDYTVDLRGWRHTATIDGHPMPGLPGVLQAEHNLLIHLNKFPDAHNLRRVFDSQRLISHEASMLVGKTAPSFAEKWRSREQTYKLLIRETRDLGGHLGKGGPRRRSGRERRRPHPASQVG